MSRWFWGALTLACLVWYSTITVYVAVKGVADIRRMLGRLAAGAAGPESESAGRAGRHE